MSKQMLNLDPFADNDNNSANNHNNSSDPSDGIQDENGFNIGDTEFDEDDDMMLDGGMHLMEDKRKQTSIFAPSNNNMQHAGSKSGGAGLLQQRDCVTQVADQCIDLNQFISKMDELVYSQHGRSSSLVS